MNALDLKRVENSAALGNTPLWFGEWSLATNFPPTEEFMIQWADAQKLAYSKGHGWIFWNFKTENLFDSGDPMAKFW
jgi:glucan endo-1,6-beta-glucosidase